MDRFDHDYRLQAALAAVQTFMRHADNIGYVDETDDVDEIIATVYKAAEDAAEKILKLVEIADDRRNDHG